MGTSIPYILLKKIESKSDKTAMLHKERGGYVGITAKELHRKIFSVAKGLKSLGLQKGERVAIMAPNGPDWAWLDLATMAIGGVSVPVYHTEGIDTLFHILKDSQSRFLYMHPFPLLGELLARLPDLPYLEKIILSFDGRDHKDVLSFVDFLENGKVVESSTIVEITDSIGENELASIIYTSGTTGLPKGVMLSHRNILSNVESCATQFPITSEDTSLSFLPLSHVFERMAGYYFMLYQGVTIAYAENPNSVPTNMAEVAPTVVTSVPRLYEKMYARIMERVNSGPLLRRGIFFFALRQAEALVDDQLAGRKSPAWREKLVHVAREKIFSKLKAAVGGKLRFFVSGGAPLRPEIAKFFFAVGIPIYEGYGLTETSPVISCNNPKDWKIGSVGKILSGTEVRVSEEGEIQVQGPGVFQGYWQDEERTKEVLNDGWFNTGDIGRVDSDGYLVITDRKKDLIVTAGGENVAPQNVEGMLKFDKFIDNSFVFGDRKPFLVALIVPNFEQLERYAAYKKINYLSYCDLVLHPKILDLIRRRVDILQRNKPPIKRVKRFVLISRDFSNKDGEVTPTLKLKRQVVANNFAPIIDGMYQYGDQGAHDSGYCIIDED